MTLTEQKKSFEKIQNILWSLLALLSLLSLVSLISSLLLAVRGELSWWEAWREAWPGGDSREQGRLILLPGSQEGLPGHRSRSGLPARSQQDKPL